jgi:hypothetical protein
MQYPAILIAMQIAVLGWRINREIPLGDKGRRTWFPVADYVNVLSLISVILYCVVLPLNGSEEPEIAKIVLTIGFILMGMYPINMIGHYRFMSPRGRSIYEKPEGEWDYPYITDHERVTLAVTAFLILVYLRLALG